MPMVMRSDWFESKATEDIISLKSREELLEWKRNREEEELSCCTSPVYTKIDMTMSKFSHLYIYNPMGVDNLILNVNNAKVEGALLTCYIWHKYRVLWSPEQSQNALYRKGYTPSKDSNLAALPSVLHGDQSRRSRDVALDPNSIWWCNGELMPTAPALYEGGDISNYRHHTLSEFKIDGLQAPDHLHDTLREDWPSSMPSSQCSATLYWSTNANMLLNEW